MIAVVDRLVQYPHRYKLTNIESGQVLGTFDLDPVLGTIQAEGTKINKALFDSIAADIATKLAAIGGDLKDTIITFDEYTGTAEIASGEKASLIIAKIKKRLKDFESNYETKTDSSKKLAEAKTYAEQQASTAKSGAISTAASDATIKASRAESNANTYTDNQIGALSKSINAELENKADLVEGKVPADQIPTAGVNVEQAEKDGSGNVITSTYETKKDATAKLSEAKTYANQQALAAKSGAISTAASDATSKANQAEANAKNYAEPKFEKNSAFNKNFGTTAGTVCEGNDGRLSDQRDPKPHTHDTSNINGFLNKTYPVGSIYMSVFPTSPAELFGGIWGKIEGRFLYGASSKVGSGTMGGESSITLKTENIPEHTHQIGVAGMNSGWGGNSGQMLDRYNNAYFDITGMSGVSHTYTNRINIPHVEAVAAGQTTKLIGTNSQPFNNMPPYYAVYIWRRAA